MLRTALSPLSVRVCSSLRSFSLPGSAHCASNLSSRMSAAKDGAVRGTFKILRGEIRIALDHLADPGLLPNVSCKSLNVTEMLGNQQPLQHQVPAFRCYTEKLSKLIPELSDTLDSSSRYLLDVEKLQNGRAVSKNCSLPNFEQELDRYVYAKCLLQFMEGRIGKLHL